MTAVSQTTLSRPRPKVFLRASLRHLIGGVAAVTVGGFLVALGLAFWEFQRRAPASAALLGPIIAYHERTSAYQIESAGGDRRTAGGLLIGGVRSIGWAARFAHRACTRPQKPNGILLPDWQVARNYSRDGAQAFGWARERMRDAEWHERMAKYHAHASAYYSGLLAAHVIALPPLPPGLAAERRAAEEEFFQIHGVRIVLEPEPLPQLLPGWKPAKRGKSTVAPFTNAPADSY